MESRTPVRANNLKTGRAFEFESRGVEAGRIQVGDTTGPPFSTNATGRVENLNADRLDGRIRPSWPRPGTCCSPWWPPTARSATTGVA